MRVVHRNARKNPPPRGETCRRGHPFTPENTRIYFRDGKEQRECLACRRIRNSKPRKKGPSPAPQRPPATTEYERELQRVLAKMASQMAAVHDDVQRRINLPYTFREKVGYMLPRSA